VQTVANWRIPGPSKSGEEDLEDGTLARALSPVPGPLGVASGTSLGEAVAEFAVERLGQTVGDGECFTLADAALRAAGAQSAADFGAVTEDADYVWGTAVSLADVLPGDIVQFRDYECTRRVDTPSEWHEESQQRPHHTAIVVANDGEGALTVYEQNVPEGAPVQRVRLHFVSGTRTSGDATVTVTVTGSVWYYRPQPAS
jgi:hypothetical protein